MKRGVSCNWAVENSVPSMWHEATMKKLLTKREKIYRRKKKLVHESLNWNKLYCKFKLSVTVTTKWQAEVILVFFFFILRFFLLLIYFFLYTKSHFNVSVGGDKKIKFPKVPFIFCFFSSHLLVLAILYFLFKFPFAYCFIFQFKRFCKQFWLNYLFLFSASARSLLRVAVVVI